MSQAIGWALASSIFGIKCSCGIDMLKKLKKTAAYTSGISSGITIGVTHRQAATNHCRVSLSLPLKCRVNQIKKHTN